MEKIKIRGLLKNASIIFILWGVFVLVKGLWDLFIGEPEANMYSLNKWDFISMKQWLTWSWFEVIYGITCITIAYFLLKYSKRLPIYILRKRQNKPTI